MAIPTAPPSSVLITGGSGVIGRAICVEFGRAGWNVGVHYRTRREEAERTARLVVEAGGRASCVPADIREAKQTRAMVESFLSQWGRLDVLICNAGQASGNLLLKTSQEQWKAAIETNLTGTFHCLRAAGPVMVGQGGGSVLVVASLSALQGTTGQAAYAAAKAGLIGLVKSAAREWGADNIRVNAVCPGWHQTDVSGNAIPDDRAITDRLSVHEHVLGRFAGLESVARSVMHLALLPDVSGQVWNLDSRIL
ncbi:MAG: SDR family NAD(P)-dependent oxidoreductase [Nitrospiraceae bacterium]